MLILWCQDVLKSGSVVGGWDEAHIYRPIGKSGQSWSDDKDSVKSISYIGFNQNIKENKYAKTFRSMETLVLFRGSGGVCVGAGLDRVFLGHQKPHFFYPFSIQVFSYICSLSMCFFAALRIINPSQKSPLGCYCGCFLYLVVGTTLSKDGWTQPSRVTDLCSQRFWGFATVNLLSNKKTTSTICRSTYYTKYANMKIHKGACWKFENNIDKFCWKRNFHTLHLYYS